MTIATETAGFALQQTRYELLGRVGRGGMSTVYRARDTALGRDVALKLFAARADDPEHLRAQQREAQLLASFRHHSLITLFDAGVDFSPDGAPRMFLTMELVDGSDLRERLRSGPLPLLHVANMGFDLADALAYLHERGVTHRDLKPANVLLVEQSEGRRPRVKLADFGIAQLGEDHGTPDETTGTAAYLSPELAAGEPVGSASDVYSLGLLLLESVTGRLAFPGGVVESAMARLDRDPEVPDELPVHWRELLRAMTARRPADRPTAPEAAVAFRQILIDELTDDRSTPPEQRVSRSAAVRRYDLLADRDDPAIDRICALAARLLRADAAAVAVHDDDRVLVKARVGRGWAAGAPVVSGVLESEAVALTEPSGDDVPALMRARPGTRAYASAPARTHDGHAVATVAVLFDAARRIDDDEAATLQDLADAVMHESEMRRAVRRLLRPA